MKGLNLQAQRGDCTGRNEGAMVVLCLLKEIRLSVIIVMREIAGEHVMEDLGLKESENENEYIA